MNISELVGEEIEHKSKTFGKGIVSAIKDKYIIVKFSDVESEFQFPGAFEKGFLRAVDDDTQKDILLLIEEKKDAEKKKAEEEKQRKQQEEEKQRKINKERQLKIINKDRTVWIKFEGAQNENSYANLHKVVQDGKDWYVLHYKRAPRNVKEDDPFFMAEGITDGMGRPRQVITGRGHLMAFRDSNFSPEEWTKFYSWIPKHPWYVIIKDFEMLDTSIRNGLMLEQVISAVGTETFEASSGKNRDYEYLMHIHTQKQHMKLTEEAEEYINNQFDLLVKKFGSKKYITVH